jgi:hypothetical protein
MRTLVILLCFVLPLSGCGEQTEQSRREVAAHKAEQDQKRSKLKAGLEQEYKLMLGPAAVPELERRLDDWLRMTNGVLLVKNESDGFRQFPGTHVVSLQTPWVVSCDTVGLEVVLGSWAQVDEEAEGASSGSCIDRLSRYGAPVSR